MPRQFEAAPVKRGSGNLFIGLTGPSSSGKTWTALELATGIVSVTGGQAILVDTENGRGRMYADDFRKPDGSPGYLYTQFEPPWGSLDYRDVIEYGAKQVGPGGVVVVDSMSHEHEGEGGLLDLQDQELRRLAGDKYGTKAGEAYNMLAWQKPKANRRKLLTAVTRSKVHVILCFRAKNSSKPVKVKFTRQDGTGGSKTEIVPQGFVPIAGDEFVYEMSLGMLFLPGAKGVPTWETEFPGERLAIKLPRQFEWVSARGKKSISRDVGVKLAEWARGEAPAEAMRPKEAGPAQSPPPPKTAVTDPPVSAAAKWAAEWEARVPIATSAIALGTEWNTAMRGQDWAILKEEDGPRADALKKSVVAKVVALKAA